MDRSKFASQMHFSSEDYNKRFQREMVKLKPRNLPFIDPAPTRQGGATVESLREVRNASTKNLEELRASLGLESHSQDLHQHRAG